jgi:perosamine synthetase
MSLLRPIHHVFAPLADRAQMARAAAMLCAPWAWKRGESRAVLKREISAALWGDTYLFGSGREALCALLRARKIQAGDEVIVQAYTCVVVPNAILAAGGTPVYADIDPATLNLNADTVRSVLTDKTRAVICQHTFGIPAPLAELRALCDKRGIPLIEDCAHVLPDPGMADGVAVSGDYALLSFGRDKAVSGVSGGAIVARAQAASDALRILEAEATDLPSGLIARYILYPLLYGIAKPFYGLKIGKVFLALCGRLGLLTSIVTDAEKHGKQDPRLRACPNACAYLALDQWRERGALNAHRRMLAALYDAESRARGWPRIEGVSPDMTLQKYPLFTRGAEAIRQTLKKRNIHLHDGWTGCVICPASVEPRTVGYADGMDPCADEVGTQILSLPTHPGTTEADARRLIEALDPLLP